MRGSVRFDSGRLLPVVLLACFILQGCYVAHAYDTVREAPDAGGVESLAVEVAAVAGEVRIGRADGDRLYDLNLRFCENHFTPRVTRSDSGGGAGLFVGVKRRRPGDSKPLHGDERNRLDLKLNPDVPLDLGLDLGAGRHYAQLGGLRLRSLDMASGSGRVSIDFDRPTSDELRRFRAIVGPGGLRLSGLGYASPGLMTLSAGGGEFSLDLGGPWDKDGVLELDVRLGDVILIVPKSLGLIVGVEGRDAEDLILPGFTRDDSGEFLSPGFPDAKRRVTVRCGRGLGVLRVELK